MAANDKQIHNVIARGRDSGANWSLSCRGKSPVKWAEKGMDLPLDIAQHAKTRPTQG
jgi:hypothetical protein